MRLIWDTHKTYVLFALTLTGNAQGRIDRGSNNCFKIQQDETIFERNT